MLKAKGIIVCAFLILLCITTVVEARGRSGGSSSRSSSISRTSSRLSSSRTSSSRSSSFSGSRIPGNIRHRPVTSRPPVRTYRPSVTIRRPSPTHRPTPRTFRHTPRTYRPIQVPTTRRPASTRQTGTVRPFRGTARPRKTVKPSSPRVFRTSKGQRVQRYGNYAAAFAAGYSVAGMARYRSRYAGTRYYKTDPQVCYTERPGETDNGMRVQSLGYFVCPSGDKEFVSSYSKSYCCGSPSQQYCCDAKQYTKNKYSAPSPSSSVSLYPYMSCISVMMLSLNLMSQS